MRGVGDLNPTGSTSVEGGWTRLSTACPQYSSRDDGGAGASSTVKSGSPLVGCSNVASVLLEALQAVIGGDLGLAKTRVEAADKMIDRALRADSAPQVQLPNRF